MRLTFCAACGRTSGLDHHHLVPRIFGGSDDETNLITLCDECHAKIHGIEGVSWKLLQAASREKAAATRRRNGPTPATLRKREERVHNLLSNGHPAYWVAQQTGLSVERVKELRKDLDRRPYKYFWRDSD
jgi:DNA-binding CsgD family transcriptional regulator